MSSFAVRTTKPATSADPVVRILTVIYRPVAIGAVDSRTRTTDPATGNTEAASDAVPATAGSAPCPAVPAPAAGAANDPTTTVTADNPDNTRAQRIALTPLE